LTLETNVNEEELPELIFYSLLPALPDLQPVQEPDFAPNVRLVSMPVPDLSKLVLNTAATA
jgi:hypothetical protein